MGDRVFFSATDGATGTEVWVSDGTFAGTTVTLDINPGAAGSSPSNFVGIGNRLFFSAAIPATGREPWCSDGTPAGTVMLGDLNPGGDSFPAFFVGLNGMVLFSAFTPAQGTELWRTDGTPAGTSLFVEIRPGPLGSSPGLSASSETNFFSPPPMTPTATRSGPRTEPSPAPAS